MLKRNERASAMKFRACIDFGWIEPAAENIKGMKVIPALIHAALCFSIFASKAASKEAR